ncbi:MAG: hypothetical protein KDD62_12925 [Bdellovibrionales bacterium]|nr:hypothetical protein [Bdellovibrionales bacterium]
MGTFGQKIDSAIFEAPRYGMYNFHPSHLAEGKYRGGNPFYEMLEAGEKTTRMTVHFVDEELDTGAVVGYSPEICIEFEEPEKWTIEKKIMALHQQTSYFVGPMAMKLLLEVKQRQGKVESIDFESFFQEKIPPQAIAKLQRPIPLKAREGITVVDI